MKYDHGDEFQSSHLSVFASGHRPSPGLGRQNGRIRACAGPVPVLHLPKLVCPEDGCGDLNRSTSVSFATVLVCTKYEPSAMIEIQMLLSREWSSKFRVPVSSDR